VMTMMLMFGLAFELPLLIIMLNLAGILTHERFRKWRRMLIFGTFLIAGIANPSPDPITMLILGGACALLVEVAEHTGAQVVVTLGAMPSQIPHSRMPLVHASSANPELAQRFGLHRPRYQGITGIVGSLQAELDARDYPAISMQVGVPYYAAGAQNWKASAALLRNLEHVTGIPTGHGLLQERVAEWEQLVDEAVAENPEASGYLPQLEAEYDRQAAEQLPSSEDLAAEFERYLRELDDPPS